MTGGEDSAVWGVKWKGNRREGKVQGTGQSKPWQAMAGDLDLQVLWAVSMPPGYQQQVALSLIDPHWGQTQMVWQRVGTDPHPKHHLLRQGEGKQDQTSLQNSWGSYKFQSIHKQYMYISKCILTSIDISY